MRRTESFASGALRQRTIASVAAALCGGAGAAFIVTVGARALMQALQQWGALRMSPIDDAPIIAVAVGVGVFVGIIAGRPIAALGAIGFGIATPLGGLALQVLDALRCARLAGNCTSFTLGTDFYARYLWILPAAGLGIALARRSPIHVGLSTTLVAGGCLAAAFAVPRPFVTLLVPLITGGTTVTPEFMRLQALPVVLASAVAGAVIGRQSAAPMITAPALLVLLLGALAVDEGVMHAGDIAQTPIFVISSALLLAMSAAGFVTRLRWPNSLRRQQHDVRPTIQ